MAESPKFRFGAVILVTGALGALVWSVVYSHALAQDEFRPVSIPTNTNPAAYVNQSSPIVPTAFGLPAPMSGGPDGGAYNPPTVPTSVPMGIGAAGGPPDPFVSPPSTTPPSANPSGPGSMGMMGIGGMGGMAQMMMGRRPGDQFQDAEREYAAQARELLKGYAAESNPQNQAELKRRLRESLITQFDLQHRRRDEELQWIEKRVAELRAKLKRRADAVNTIVDRRLEQLISDVDGLGWGADDLPQDLFEMGMSGNSTMSGRGRRPSNGMMDPAAGAGMRIGPMRSVPMPSGPGRPGGMNAPTPPAIQPPVTPQPRQPVELPAATPGIPGAVPGTPGSATNEIPYPVSNDYKEPSATLDPPRTETPAQPAIPGAPAEQDATVPVGVPPGSGIVPPTGIPSNT